MRFAIFPLQLSKLLRLQRKSDARSYEVLHLSRKIIFLKLTIWCSKMQPLSGNQRPDLLTALMNISLVPRLPRKISLQILFKCPTPAIVFGNATKPSRLITCETTSEWSKVVQMLCYFNLQIISFGSSHWVTGWLVAPITAETGSNTT